MLHVGFGKNETNPLPRRITGRKHKAGECDAQARDEISHRKPTRLNPNYLIRYQKLPKTP
jgi:hypothetical protein